MPLWIKCFRYLCRDLRPDLLVTLDKITGVGGVGRLVGKMLGELTYLRALTTQQTIRMARIMRMAPAVTEAMITVSFCFWDCLLGSAKEFSKKLQLTYIATEKAICTPDKLLGEPIFLQIQSITLLHVVQSFRVVNGESFNIVMNNAQKYCIPLYLTISFKILKLIIEILLFVYE